MSLLILAARHSAVPLKFFFSFLLPLVLGAGAFLFRDRKRFFSHAGDRSDSYASANLRMWLVILVWIHAVVITTLMIFEV